MRTLTLGEAQRAYDNMTPDDDASVKAVLLSPKVGDLERELEAVHYDNLSKTAVIELD